MKKCQEKNPDSFRYWLGKMSPNSREQILKDLGYTEFDLKNFNSKKEGGKKK